VTPSDAARVAAAVSAEDSDAVVEVAWSDDGLRWRVEVEQASGAGPPAIANALRAMATALESTAN
jgi:hypothetical protein